MMIRKIGVTATLGLLAIAALSHASFAACPTLGSPSAPMIQFDADCWAYETSYDASTYNSSAGSVLTIVGIINGFNAPLAFLNAADPNKEYTFVCSNLVSAGTVTANPFGSSFFYDTDYNGGTFTIYEGSPRNAPTAATIGTNPAGGATVPANFQDGTAIMTGSLCGFHTSISKTGTQLPNGSWTATYAFTNPNAPGPPPAGNLFNLLGDAQAAFGGLWCVRTGSCTPATYSAHPNGKWDSPPSTGAVKSTWGTLKTLYR